MIGPGGAPRAGVARRAGSAVRVLALAAVVIGCSPQAGPAATVVHLTPRPSTPRPPTPPPTPAPVDAAVDGLVAIATGESSTYRVAFEGRSRHSADVLPISGSLEVAGDDARLVARFTFPEAGGDGTVEVRVVDGMAWRSFDGGAFADISPATEAFAPLPLDQAAAPDDVMPVSPTPDADGRFSVEFDSMVIHPAFIPAVNLSNADVDRSRLTLLVDADGRPISGQWELRGKGRISGQLQEIVIELELTFSGLGSEIVIREPADP